MSNKSKNYVLDLCLRDHKILLGLDVGLDGRQRRENAERERSIKLEERESSER